jgi:membrane protein required for colicin V production
MTWLDYFMIGILGFTLLRGLWRGTLQETLAMIVLLLAPAIALLLAPLLAEHLVSLITLTALRLQTAFFILFFMVLLAGFFIRYLIARLSGEDTLSLQSRLVGGFLGLIRGAILINLLLILGQHYQLNETSSWKESTMIPYFNQITGAGMTVINRVEIKYNVNLPTVDMAKKKVTS